LVGFTRNNKLGLKKSDLTGGIVLLDSDTLDGFFGQINESPVVKERRNFLCVIMLVIKKDHI